MVIYGEYLFAENFASGIIALILTKMILDFNVSKFRLFFGGILSGIASFLIFFETSFVTGAFIKIITCFVIVISAFGRKLLYKSMFVFLLTTVMLGAFAFVLLCCSNNFGISNNGYLYMEKLSYHFIIMALASGFMVLLMTVRLAHRHKIKSKIFKEIKVVILGKIFTAKAIIDSGNSLKDPITRSSVIVISRALSKKISESFAKEELVKRVCIIPFVAVGTQNGIMQGIRAEFIEIDEKRFYNVVLGFNKKDFSGDFDALLNVDMLKGSLI